MCFHPESTEIAMGITNKGADPIRISFDESWYVDEKGLKHAIARSTDNEEVAAGSRRVIGFGPREKIYFVKAGPLQEVEFAEPLLPMSFEGLSFDETEAVLDQLSNQGREVRVGVTIDEIETGCKTAYLIGFALKPLYSPERWEEVREISLGTTR